MSTWVCFVHETYSIHIETDTAGPEINTELSSLDILCKCQSFLQIVVSQLTLLSALSVSITLTVQMSSNSSIAHVCGARLLLNVHGCKYPLLRPSQMMDG